MKPLLHLVKKELLVLVRDWHALLLLFAMPVMFILVMSLALRDRFAIHQGVALNFYLVNADDDALSRDVETQIRAESSFRMLAADASEEELLARVARDEAHFLVVVPAGFAEHIDAAEPLPVRISAGPGVEPAVLKLFETAVRGIVSRIHADRAINALKAAVRRQRSDPPAGQGGAYPDRAVGGDDALEPEGGRDPGAPYRPEGPDSLEEEGVGDLGAAEKLVRQTSLYRHGHEPEVPSSVQQNVPAWLVFAMFFIAIPLSTTWVQERQQGTFTRLRAMGLARRWLLLGKLLPYFGINLLQVVSMLAVGLWVVPLFGGDVLTMGESPAGLVLMAVALSFASVAYALLIANVVSTSEQATIFTGVSNLLLAAIGGIMVPRFVMPAAMQELSLYSPMAWGMEGFLDIFLRRGGVAEVSQEALALFGFGLVSLLVAAFCLSRTRGK